MQKEGSGKAGNLRVFDICGSLAALLLGLTRLLGYMNALHFDSKGQ